jgi:hypothetical protein
MSSRTAKRSGKGARTKRKRDVFAMEAMEGRKLVAILVVGSVAFDSLETPSGKRERVLGGAATHFALAASFFTDVRVVGVVGEDFLPEHEAVLTVEGYRHEGY